MPDALRAFVESRVAFVEHALHVWETSHDKQQRNSAKYCFKQAFFYAAVNYLEWRPFVSEGAVEEAEKRGLSHHFPDSRWDAQPAFDPKRQVFHFEHVFTGEMCWNAVSALRGHIDVSNLEVLLRDNYAIAWILKVENKRLPQSTRGKTLQEALLVYERHNIKLMR